MVLLIGKMIHLGDCVEGMSKLPSGKIDVVFADPPYFLSNGGLSIRSGKVVSVNKGVWDSKAKCSDTKAFTEKWLRECHRLLKETGTLWVSGTEHNVFEVYEVIKRLGFKIINIIIWHKTDPPPLIYKSRFRFSYEYIIWAGKTKRHFFDYEKMLSINGTEMDDVWTLPAVSKSEKLFGYHPTQKPECLLERIISCSSRPGEIVLDPFMGSGTTGAVAVRLGRKFVGFEKEKEYYEIAQARIQNAKTNKR